MPTHCPLCGSLADYAESAGPVALGRCPSCGGAFTVIDGLSGTLAPTLGGGEGSSPEGGGPVPSNGDDAPSGPPPRADRGRPRWNDRRPMGGPRDDAPRTRPCRECGGPLHFSTGPDGGIVGECASCGNRFTLPPRRDGGGGGGGFRRGGGSGFRRNDRGGRPPWRPGGNRRFTGRRFDRGGDDDDRPRRRRPRSDE